MAKYSIEIKRNERKRDIWVDEASKQTKAN